MTLQGAYTMKELNEIIREMDGLKMSEEQKCYAIAKAWYETLNETAAEIEKKILQAGDYADRACAVCNQSDLCIHAARMR